MDRLDKIMIDQDGEVSSLCEETITPKCPMCDNDLTDDSVILDVLDNSRGKMMWNMCCLGCACVMYKRQYPNIRNVQATIYPLLKRK